MVGRFHLRFSAYLRITEEIRLIAPCRQADQRAGHHHHRRRRIDMRHRCENIAGCGKESADRGIDTPDQDHRNRYKLREALHAAEAEIGVDNHDKGKHGGHRPDSRKRHQPA